ncbi:MAG TPA: TIGR02677 family protein [Polyangiaceae bacterium]|nr:TIGR02677 family protein [Polyangiaceae bacterium]
MANGSCGDDGRSLFRYVVGEEWSDYRAIMTVFAGTFFSEFTPEEVAGRLADAGHSLDAETVADRLDSLRRWGNLTVSSAVGNPSSLAEYYRRRNRYLITRAGQEVHQVVEGVLTRVDEVRDVSTGRLRALQDALDRLTWLDPSDGDPSALVDAVGAVFDPHEAFTSEITQFFAAINQWQNRYDLTPDELRFFAEVLVGYVGERLDEIERAARPIGQRLELLMPRFPLLAERASHGLASRVDAAGLSGRIAVSHRSGSRVDDWDHLCAWFLRRPGRPSRVETLAREAIAAVRTLTLNLTRLSRSGVGAASRRADLLRLARFFDTADADSLPRIAGAAFGIGPANHYGVVAEDVDDPVSTTTSWWEAPRARVPVSIRERGETTNRGSASPIPDRTKERELLRRRREQERAAIERVDHELLDLPALDGSSLSAGALIRLQALVSRTLNRLGTRERVVEYADRALACRIERSPGRHTRVHSPSGVLTLQDLTISIAPRREREAVSREPADAV